MVKVIIFLLLSFISSFVYADSSYNKDDLNNKIVQYYNLVLDWWKTSSKDFKDNLKSKIDNYTDKNSSEFFLLKDLYSIVWYDKWTLTRDYIKNNFSFINVDSFKMISPNIWIDKDNVYFVSIVTDSIINWESEVVIKKIIEGINTNNVKTYVLSYFNIILYDKIFYFVWPYDTVNKIDYLDIDTFKINFNDFANNTFIVSDKNGVYYLNNALITNKKRFEKIDIDIKTFQILKNWYFQDKNNFYRDDKNYFYANKIIKWIDYKNIKTTNWYVINLDCWFFNSELNCKIITDDKIIDLNTKKTLEGTWSINEKTNLETNYNSNSWSVITNKSILNNSKNKNHYSKQLIISRFKIKKLKKDNYINKIDKLIPSIKKDRLELILSKIQKIETKNDVLDYLEAKIYLEINK